MLVLAWLVFDLAVLTAAAVATTDGDADTDKKLGGGGDEYDDVPLVHLVQFGLLVDATLPGDDCDCCSEDEGSAVDDWYEGSGGEN